MSGCTDTCDGEIVVRAMHAGDLAAVEAIENRTYDPPWPIVLFSRQMKRPSGICLVAQCERRLAGYLVADMFIDVWHVMNVCVDARYRRRGIATRLLQAYFTLTDAHPHRGHTLEVRASNAGAQSLYLRLGFVVTGVRPAYYSDYSEDAISMWRDRRGAAA